jgi:hypothetical protein
VLNVHGPDPAGQGDEGIGEVGHLRLALVHRADDVEFGEVAVELLQLEQPLGDDTDRLAPGRQGRVGGGAHQAASAAAVDEPDPALRQLPPELARRLAVLGPIAVAGAGEDADALYR